MDITLGLINIPIQEVHNRAALQEIESNVAVKLRSKQDGKRRGRWKENPGKENRGEPDFNKTTQIPISGTKRTWELLDENDEVMQLEGLDSCKKLKTKQEVLNI